MATRIYSINPGQENTDVNEAVGPTGTSGVIAIVVDLATTTVGDGTTTRAVKLSEVLKALEDIKNYIMRDNSWPPA